MINTDPATYEFRVNGHLDAHWAPWLGDFTITHLPDGTSTFTGPITDQSHLHGVLAALRDTGTTLLSVQMMITTTRPDGTP